MANPLFLPPCPVSQLFPCFLGRSLESGSGLSGQKPTFSLAEKDREGMSVHTHTRQLLCPMGRSELFPFAQGCLRMPLKPIPPADQGSGPRRQEGKPSRRGLFPPDPTPSTFSTSLLPSFASPVNAIKHTSVPDPLGTWNVAYKLLLSLAISGPVQAPLHSNDQRGMAGKAGLGGEMNLSFVSHGLVVSPLTV